jgi:hypothetical protein
VDTTHFTNLIGAKQNILTAGNNITITGDVISASDSRVTDVSYHYTPAANSSAALSVSASGGGVLAWGGSFLTGVTIQRDAKGHVTGVTGSSVKLPAYPSNVKQTASTASEEYPVLIKSNTGAGETTSNVQFASGITINPSSNTLTATSFTGTLNGTASKATADGNGQNIALTYAKISDIPDVSGFATKSEVISSAGTGLSISGTTINHSNSVTAKTSYVGSATEVPRIMYDAQGHITATTTATIYPPTSAGTKGQVWRSDGSGAGAWETPDAAPTSSSTKLVTSGAVYDLGVQIRAEIPNITISFDEPSGGSNGDIWFKYSL